ncbi:AAA family ATPase [Phycicoccus sp. M110.8]|uniref:helix-turn-helix transcriptional regulator n=1 Tax=Phycicoccus sp. M110.8 TaxID=3075433 RepID=UPI0028FDB1C1|nr:AAA family ATPase [Phycicoccus sp. M110.8]MDU0313123.1 AAA family ATPase [Phycicoccus sp. M110.8]
MAAAHGLVGRLDELATAETAIRSLVARRASALVVEGEAGIGKTRLVEAMVEAAQPHGLTVLRGQAHPFERSRPFGLVSAALGLRRRAVDPRRAAIAALLSGGAGPGSGELHYRVVEEVVDLVESSCADRPVLLVAEDVHWADPASLLTISSLVRRLPLSALSVVVTVRPAPRSADVVRLLEDLSEAGGAVLRLGPLSSAEILDLAAQRLGGLPGPGLAAMLEGARGNPLWALALLRSLVDDGMLSRTGVGVEAASPGVPTSLSELVVRRLGDLPEETLEMLRVAAALGDAVQLRDLGAVAQRSEADVARHLRPAYDARLLDEAQDQVVFRHQLVHDAIHQDIPGPVRRALHREAAVALMAAGASPLGVADHLMLGSQTGDHEAVAWLRAAARDAAAQSGSVAVELLRRAEALLPDGHPDADLLALEVVQAMIRAGLVTEGTARAEAVLARRHAPETDTPLRLALVGGLALLNRADELMALVRDSLDELGPAEQVPVLAQLSWVLTYRGDPRAGEESARRALRLAEATGHAGLTVWALTALLVAVGRQGRFDEALGQARRAADLAEGGSDVSSLPLQPSLFLGLALFDADLVAEARAAYRAALDDEFGSGWWLAETLMADAEACFAVGDWDDAVPRLVAGGEAAREKGKPMLLAQSLAHRTVIATATGDLEAAGQLARELAAWVAEEDLPYNAGAVAVALSGVWEAEGDRQAAYDLLLRCWRSDTAGGSRYYHRRLGPDLVRLALALGHPDVAAEVAADLAADAALAPGVGSVRSVALRCRGLVDADADTALEAVDLARQAPFLLDRTGACEDAATLLVRSRRSDEAVALLLEALACYEDAGASARAARVRAQLRELGAHPRARGHRNGSRAGWDGLTRTERAVSLLVAEGLTNGAVAKRLYVSPHTVNTHLRHVFAKLGVSNRVELARVVHRSIG